MAAKPKSIRPIVRAKCKMWARASDTRHPNQMCIFIRRLYVWFLWVSVLNSLFWHRIRMNSFSFIWNASKFFLWNFFRDFSMYEQKKIRQLNFSNWPMKLCDKCVHDVKKLYWYKHTHTKKRNTSTKWINFFLPFHRSKKDSLSQFSLLTVF